MAEQAVAGPQYASQVMLVTGIQGSGKTLSTLVRIKAWAEGSKRTVYYARINELTLPWEVLEDADRWYEVPDGSIVVIDEAQKGGFAKDWKPKLAAVGANESGQIKTSRAVTELETLRHRGINLVLITQHPMLLHPNVRRLCGLRFHVVRPYGMQKATIHEWHTVQSDPDGGAAKRDSIKHLFSYPREAFGYYKSAEVHTIKRRIPMRVKLLMLLPIVLVALGYGIYRHLMKRVEAKPVATASVTDGQQGGLGGGAKVATPRDYLGDRVPRVPGLPSTAPVYDKLTEPRIAPKPVACVASGARCSCYTQQGTKMPSMPLATCRSIVENGYFDDAPDPVNRADSTRIPVKAEAVPVGEATPPRGVVVGQQEGPWLADPGIRSTPARPTARTSNGGASGGFGGGPQPPPAKPPVS